MKSKTSTLLRAAAFAAVIFAAGCANNDIKTQKQVATQEWNAARAAVLFSLASDQYKTGNVDAARKTAGEALSLDPQNVNIRVLSARLDVEAGKLESAQSMLQTAQAIDAANAEVDYLFGVIHQRWQRPQLAHDNYAAASKKKPDDLAYLLAQAEMLVELRKDDAALELLLSRVVYFEHSGAIRDAIGQLYEQKGDLGKALDFYRQASVLEQDDDAVRERLALALYRHGDTADALSQLSRLLKTPAHAGRADLTVAAAECELTLGRSFDARERFERATTLQPGNAAAWQGIAKACVRLSDLRRGEMAASKAVALAPTDAQAHLLLGLVRLRQGRRDEALTCFARANQFDKSDPTSLCMMGLALEQAGRHEEAIGFYGQALTLAPKDDLAGRLLAEASSGN